MLCCGSAWLRDDDDPMIRRVSNKVRALSNLTLWTAEELQVLIFTELVLVIIDKLSINKYKTKHILIC